MKGAVKGVWTRQEGEKHALAEVAGGTGKGDAALNDPEGRVGLQRQTGPRLGGAAAFRDLGLEGGCAQPPRKRLPVPGPSE